VQGKYIVRAEQHGLTIQQACELADQWARLLGREVQVRLPWWRCWPLGPVVVRAAAPS
jgi:hypothetical protein